jgi:WD40 repeat protein
MSNDATQPPPTRAGDLPTMSVDAPITAPLARPRREPAEPVKPKIDGYDVLTVAGEGAMGTVWKATQLGTRRTVALKLMRAHVFASERARLRFEREVEITARLEHPNIARIYDSGVHEGVFYYAMEFIEGVPLDAYIKQKQLDPRQILGLFKTVCEAVEHAHLRGVIHRDLKPGNIIVDAEGRPRVLDFGLAKALQEQTRSHEVSLDGDVSGTPAFMSPEQASGHNETLDTRTDVFSLGVILYRLMCHAPPHEVTGTHQQLMQRIIDQDAKRPRTVCAEVDRELEALLLKALARNREERYKSAGDLARDIDNYLRHEPLMARVPTTAYFLRKRLWRYRVPLSIAAGVLLTLMIVAVVAYVQVVKQRNIAIDQRQRAEAQERLARLSDGQTRIALGDARASERIGDALALYQDAYRILAPLGAQARAELGLIETFRQITPPLAMWQADLGGVVDAALMPQARLVALASSDGRLRVFDLAQGTVVQRIDAHAGTVTSVATTADGRILTGGSDGLLRLWSADGAALARVRLGDGWVTRVDISADGDRAVAAIAPSVVDLSGGLHQLVMVELPGGRELFRRPLDGARTQVRLVGDEHVFTTGDAFTLHDRTGMQIKSERGVDAAALQADGRSILLATEAGGLRRLDLATLAVTELPSTTSGRLIDIAATTNGLIVAAYEDGTASAGASRRFARFSTPTPLPLPIHADFSRDAGLVLTVAPRSGSTGDLLTLWDVNADPTRRTQPAAGPITRLALSGDLVIAHANQRIHAHSLTTGQAVELVPPDAAIDALAVGGSRLAVVERGMLKLRDLRSSDEWKTLPSLPASSVVTVALNDKHVAAAMQDGTLVLHDETTGAQRVLIEKEPRFNLRALAFSPDGSKLVAAGRGIRVWETSTGQLLATDSSHSDRINAIAFSPDGKTLVSGSGVEPVPVLGNDYSVRTWSMDGQPARVLGTHAAQVNAVAFFPPIDAASGAVWLASGSSDGTIRIWDASTRELIRTLGGEEPILSLAVSADGRQLLAGDGAGHIRVWDLNRPGRQLELQEHVRPIMSDATRRSEADNVTLARWYALMGRPDWALAVGAGAPAEEKQAWEAMAGR